jgi:isopentenyl phosphate kinase
VTDLVFLKLGGALLTEKDRRETPRPDVLARLIREIGRWPGSRGHLVLAHGSGSYAHVAARETAFLERPGDRLALARVAGAARRLDGLVVDALVAASLPAAPLPGAALVRCRDGQVVAVRSELVTGLLEAGLLPVVYGDAVPDETRGGTIASTEPLLAALAMDLKPRRIVLATDVDGVFPADPHAHPALEPWPTVGPANAADVLAALGGARPGTADVTGGMASKVRLMVELAEAQPGLEVRILSGLRPDAVRAALAGEPDAGGTVIRAG